MAFLEKDEKSDSIELGINACGGGAVMEGRSLDILDPLSSEPWPEDNSANFSKKITTNFLKNKKLTIMTHSFYSHPIERNFANKFQTIVEELARRCDGTAKATRCF